MTTPDSPLILVVEDEISYQHVYKMKLENAGFQVTTANNGEEALFQCERQVPDLIILDLIMPIKDGFATLEELRKNTKWKAVPVIITSNLSQDEDINRAMELGANSYFIKSNISISEIPHIIRKHLDD